MARNRLRLLPSCALVLLAGAAPGFADYNEALTAYEQGNYLEAYEGFLPLAREGDLDAQFRLGLLFEHGRGVERDPAAAAEWYRRAAELGHGPACTNLGSLYYHGLGVEQSFEDAARWYTIAADQGRAVAQTNLGGMYESGQGVEASAERAAHYYKLAAADGDADALHALARLYEQGHGVKQSDPRAARLYRKAAGKDHADSQVALARLYAEGRGVRRNPHKAGEWYRSAAALGHPDAQRLLNELYASRGDLPVEPPTPEPETRTKPPAVSTTPAGPTPTPVASPDEEGVDDLADDDAAPEPEAAVAPPPASPDELDDPDELYQVARRYARGIGVPKDEREAIHWYREAAMRGHKLASYRVALLYLRGRGIEQPDLLRAHVWFSVSANRGVGDAADWRERVAKKLSRRELDESARMLAELEGRPAP